MPDLSSAVPRPHRAAPGYPVLIPSAVATRLPARPLLVNYVTVVEILAATGEPRMAVVRSDGLEPETIRGIAATFLDRFVAADDGVRAWRRS